MTTLTEMLTERIISEVFRMHRLFLQDAYRNPRPHVPAKSLEFRRRLILEETRETATAMEYTNKVKLADGLCDMAVVAAGTRVEFGTISIDPHQKHELWVENGVWDLTSRVLRTLYNDNPTMAEIDILNNLSAYILTNFVCLDKIRPDLNLMHNFGEVMRANRAKVFDDADAALRDSIVYNDRGIPTTTRYNEACNCYIILREDGKFMKPLNWKEPEIKVSYNEGV